MCAAFLPLAKRAAAWYGKREGSGCGMKRKIAAVLAVAVLLALLSPGAFAAQEDLRSAPLERVVCIGAVNYLDELTALIAKYQCNTPEVTRLDAAQIDRVAALRPELLLYAPDEAAFSEEAAVTVRQLAAQMDGDGVFVVCGFGDRPDHSPEAVAKALSSLRLAADAAGALYFDACAALAGTPWCAEGDGQTPNPAGKLLLAHGLFSLLARHCTCLAAEHTAPLDMDETPRLQPNDALLSAFAAAEDAAALQTVLESRETALPLTAYQTMQAEERTAFLTALAKTDRSGATSWDAAEEVYMTALLAFWRGFDRKSVLKNEVLTYVATGDSISCGATAVHPENGWVTTLAGLLTAVSGREVRLVNKAVSGSRMCLKTTWADYPPAKDTVRDYIVPNHPDLLTAAFGINDLRADVPLETFLAAYRGYVREVQENCPETVIVLVGMIPMGNGNQTEKILQWNVAIRGLAEELGVLFADPFDDLYGTEWLLTDNLHPCDVGYRVQAGAILRNLCAQMDFAGASAINWENPFRDVAESDWFWPEVRLAVRHGLFDGVAPDAFAPEAAMTRAMLVTVLWRLDGKRTAGASAPFSDVPAGAYYADAVAWAAENGIVNGVGDGKFDPEGSVTREQLAAILFRYAGTRRVDTAKRADLAAFPDAGEVSAYARDALAWANAADLIRGSAENGTLLLVPQNTATRAQVAAILVRYLTGIAQ